MNSKKLKLLSLFFCMLGFVISKANLNQTYATKKTGKFNFVMLQNESNENIKQFDEQTNEYELKIQMYEQATNRSVEVDKINLDKDIILVTNEFDEKKIEAYYNDEYLNSFSIDNKKFEFEAPNKLNKEILNVFFEKTFKNDSRNNRNNSNNIKTKDSKLEIKHEKSINKINTLGEKGEKKIVIL